MNEAGGVQSNQTDGLLCTQVGDGIVQSMDTLIDRIDARRQDCGTPNLLYRLLLEVRGALTMNTSLRELRRLTTAVDRQIPVGGLSHPPYGKWIERAEANRALLSEIREALQTRIGCL